MLKYTYNSAYGDVAVFRLSDITFVIIEPEGKEAHTRLVNSVDILAGDTDTLLDDLPESMLQKIVRELEIIKENTVMMPEKEYIKVKEDADKWQCYSARWLQSAEDTNVQLTYEKT